MKKITVNYINKFIEEHPDLAYLQQPLCDCVEIMVNAAKKDKQILVCGNGGSAADSEHIAGELLKSFTLKRKPPVELHDKLVDTFNEDGHMIADNIQMGVKCIPLTSFCAFNTAFLNDCNEKMLFAQLVNVLGDTDDVLLAISTSGNSKNVCYAAQMAKVKGLKVVALTGDTGGKLKQLADVLLNAPSKIVYKIQEYHLPIYHLICLCVENEMFDM